MQQTLNTTWAQKARVKGALRYHQLTLGRTVLYVLAILLVADLLALAFPLFTDIDYNMEGVQASLGTTLFVSLVCCCTVANKSTRFLLRFGTPRFSTWLCNLVGLIAAMLVFLLGTLLVSLALNGLALWGMSAAPARYTLGAYAENLTGPAFFSATLTDALGSLPRYALYTAEWTSVFYLLACCLRRNKAVTLCVLIGVPLLMSILMFIPAINEAVHTVQSGDQSQMTLLGLKWMQIGARILEFIKHQWQWLQLGAAVVSLPLSYLCMRGTTQP